MSDKPIEKKLADAMSSEISGTTGQIFLTMTERQRILIQQIDYQDGKLAEQQREIDRLKEILRKVQWYDFIGGTSKRHHDCVGCDYNHGTDGKSHAADCPVNNVLTEPAEKTQ